MKFIYIFVVLLLLINNSFSQELNASISQKKYDSIIKKVSSLENQVKHLEKKISDSKLETSITTAESVINKQNNLINGFEVLYGVISVLILVVSLFTYFFNIRPLIHQAERAVQGSETAISNLNSRMDHFNQIIEGNLNERFAEYEKKQQAERINQIFSDLCGNFPNQRKLALEQLSTVSLEEITSAKVYQLFEFLDANQTNEEERITVVELLLQKNTPEIKIFFRHWSNVRPDDYSLIRLLIKYYTENGFNNYLSPVSNFIITHVTPHLAFKTISGYLSSYEINGIIQLVNFQQLVAGINDYNKKEISDFLNGMKTIWNKENEIDQSLLFESAAS